MDKKSSEWVKYSGLGIQMAVSVILCLYIGKWIGGKYNHETIGSLIGIFFGLFALFIRIFRLINEKLFF